jgi:MFS family permease
LLGSLLLVVGSLWAGRSRSYKSMLWARVIQGVAVAPFEALVNASVGDLFFVHVSRSLTNGTSTGMWLIWNY